MSRKKLLLVFFLFLSVLLLICSIYYYALLHQTTRQHWLATGTYVTYEQFLVWNNQNETQYMTWNVTRLGDSADLYLVSHGVNVTNRSVAIVTGEANWTIDTSTREVLSSSDSNYVGKKWPFWLQTDLRIGSSVDTWYGVNTVSRSETINVLGQQRDCWIVDYDWATSTMRRWYDKSSGVCLKIHVVLHQQNITITTTETAVSTNIDLKQ
ncbi:hypothetical protein MUP01_13530 [Candidatus Bathyarchaeota archaeon]|nr:hypothetical protein [Candidatus Bathyarchaeota archaeon]